MKDQNDKQKIAKNFLTLDGIRLDFMRSIKTYHALCFILLINPKSPVSLLWSLQLLSSSAKTMKHKNDENEHTQENQIWTKNLQSVLINFKSQSPATFLIRITIMKSRNDKRRPPKPTRIYKPQKIDYLLLVEVKWLICDFCLLFFRLQTKPPQNRRKCLKFWGACEDDWNAFMWRNSNIIELVKSTSFIIKLW